MIFNINGVISNVLGTFLKNVNAVEELMTFDGVILEFCINNLEQLDNRLKGAGFDNPRLRVGNTIQAIRNIRDNASLKTRYEEMQNQCLVLLVSYFSLSVRDLFRGCLAYALHSGNLGNLARHDVKILLEDLRAGADDFGETVADIFIAQKDISFQDMQSIGRALGEYFGFKPEKDNHVNNIILSQACRHAIVHNEAKADVKLVKQIAGAKPRDLKLNLSNGQKIQFQPDEIRLASQSMMSYLHTVSDGLTRQWGI